MIAQVTIQIYFSSNGTRPMKIFSINNDSHSSSECYNKSFAGTYTVVSNFYHLNVCCYY